MLSAWRERALKMNPAGGQPIVRVEDLTKDFPAVRALDGVNLEFHRGEVHGIVGENGAGKSTLVKIISGLYRPTSGRVLYAGRAVAVTGPAHAMRLGIAMVHQELNLVSGLSAADNIFLGRERTRAGLIDLRRTHREARELLGRIGCDIDPGAKLTTLPIAHQQMVEIAKALSLDANVLIMDEPTGVLTRREATRLFQLIDRLRSQGVSVLYISHILSEVLEICDRITVMRDGQVVRTLARAEAGRGPEAEAVLGSLMVGRTLGDHFPRRLPPGAETLLEVRNLSVPGRVHGVSLELRAGEVLGLAGLVGAGRTELGEAIAGLRKHTDGTVLLNGTDVTPRRPREAVDVGIAYVSEDRRGRGLLLGRSVIENTTIVSLQRFAKVLIDTQAERRVTQEQVEALSIRLGRLGDPIDTLSGGNQQKVAVAKWLTTAPKVLILDEPTRGIDIGAKEEMYRLIRQLASRGMGCMFISSELNELLGMCHRIAVLRGGRIVAIVAGDEMTEENVMFHAAGVKGASVA